MKSFDFTTYLSPFTWRYGGDAMRAIWSEEHKRQLWRKIWVALARAQEKQGLLSKKEFDDLVAHENDIDIEQSHEIEKDLQHDLMAEIKTYASQAKKGGGKIHLGATSMDIEDNADTIRIKESLEIIEPKLKQLLKSFAKKIDQYKALPCMAYTHLQPAEPTTTGYRFAFYAQDIVFDKKLLDFVKKELKGKGLKAAVGTSASYVSLLDKQKAQDLEHDVLQTLSIDAVTIASQTAPRKFEFFVSSFLASLAQSLYKFAFDVRLMQSPLFGEWQEPFGKKQVGSSAMPFKKNPIKSEQICSLARLVFSLSRVPLDNAAHMLLERTLDDSANRRVVLPEMFLATDAILDTATKIVDELVINEKQIEKNLDKFGPFAATESLMMQAVKKGADRQVIHELLREHAMKANEAMSTSDKNPLIQNLLSDKTIQKYLTKEEIKESLHYKTHIGLAVEKCNEFLRSLHK